MKKLNFFCIALFFLFPFLSYGNINADIVFCSENTLGIEDGFYARDFLYLQDEFPGFEWASIEDIRLTFWHYYAGITQFTKVYDLSFDFSNFSRSILTPDDSRANHIWKEAAFGWKDIGWKDFSADLKHFCPGKDSYGIIALKKVFQPGKRIYEYSPQALQKLSSQTNLQKAFVLMREWIENYTLDDARIRGLSKVYLSKATLETIKKPSNDEEFESLIQDLRRSILFLLEKPRPPELSLCHRSRAFVYALEKKLKNRCDFIDPRDLLEIREFKIHDIRIPGEIITFDEFEFYPNDLQGLENLESLDLTDLPWLGTSLRSGYFKNLPNLKKIDFRSSNISWIWPELFSGLNSLEQLKLDELNFLDHIEPESFNGIFSPKGKNNTLSLKNSLSGLPLARGTFGGAENLHSLDLSGNRQEILKKGGFDGLRDLRSLKLPEHGAPTETPIVTAESLPNLEILDLGNLPYMQVEGLISLKELRFGRIGFSLDEDFVEKFPNLENIDLSGSGWSFGDYPTNFDTLKKLKVIRANELWNGLPESIVNPHSRLPSSLELYEFCHQRIGEFGVRAIADKVFENHTSILIRAKPNCRGDWIEIHN